MIKPRHVPLDRKAKIAVLDDYMGVAHQLADWDKLRQRAEVTFLTQPLSDPVSELAQYDAICLLRERTAITSELLHALPGLRAIIATGRHNRTLAYETAAELGITVLSTTGSGNGQYATVELAWGLIISLMRQIPEEAAAMKSGGWQTRLGNSLYGKTIGIIGLGRLGSRMAHVAKAFGMNVLAWSPNLTSARAETAGAVLVPRNTLLSQSDVVTLQLVLGETTRGILDANALEIMKPDAILINTSRGPLIDQTALIAALKEGRLRAAGIDVFDHEPLSASHPLRELDNALLTPHLGYSVRETFESFYQETVKNLENWLNGKPGLSGGAT
ncbi:D-2-hydroxyacid dehydrogenase family protein [Agrobacterium sp. T29]|uniref:D-2-hydroxyacid dehydrogenase family protein n=1 Tax=Agrobacterium sp. T29 TaxID=2580515 RepID=UPI00115F4D47|nr:D-2-hydroxyacid dehydrogenase family protein [Agrobacterium sp. T29]